MLRIISVGIRCLFFPTPDVMVTMLELQLKELGNGFSYILDIMIGCAAAIRPPSIRFYFVHCRRRHTFFLI